MLLAEKLKSSNSSLSMGRCSYTWKERDKEKDVRKRLGKVLMSTVFSMIHPQIRM
jgi:hypothetical protein